MNKSLIKHTAEKAPSWTALLIALGAAFQVWHEAGNTSNVAQGGLGNSQLILELGKRLDAQERRSEAQGDLITILIKRATMAAVIPYRAPAEDLMPHNEMISGILDSVEESEEIEGKADFQDRAIQVQSIFEASVKK